MNTTNCGRGITMLFVTAALMLYTYAAHSQSLSRWLFVSSADYIENERGALWVSCAQPLAGRVSGAALGWIGFYPIARAIAPVSVPYEASTPSIWPQPARLWVHVRTERDTLHIVDLYGRTVTAGVERVGAGLVRVDVSLLSSGVYAIEGVGMLRVW